MTSREQIPIDAYMHNRLREGKPKAEVVNALVAMGYNRAQVETRVEAVLRDMRTRKWRDHGVRGAVWGGLWTALVVTFLVTYNLWGASWFDDHKGQWYGVLAIVAALFFTLSGIASAITFLFGIVRVIGSIGLVYSMWFKAKRWDGRVSADPGSYRYPSRDRGDPW